MRKYEEERERKRERERDEFMWFDIKCVCLVYGRLFAQHKTKKKKKTKNVV